LVVDDAPLADAIQRQWQARSDTPVNIQQATSAEMLTADDEGWSAEVVVFPSGLLGEFAEHDRIVPFGKRQLESESFDRRDVFETLRRGETIWGKETFAFSLGSPQYTLMYRQDIFDALDLTPPTTWTEYQQLVARLEQRDSLGEYQPPPDQPWSGTREPHGPGWASQTLLARAAPYVRHPHQYSALFDLRDMRSLIDGEPFVKALNELVKAASPTVINHAASPAEARADLFSGRCAMTLSWPSHADSTAEGETTSRPSPIGFAALPGSPQVYNFRNQIWEPRGEDDETMVPLLGVAGRLVGLTRTGRRSSAANTMIQWLGGVELGDTVAPNSASTTLFRASQIATARRWVNAQLDDRAIRDYGELAGRLQSQPVWLESIRIPGRQRYLGALDEAVQKALDGESAQTALTSAAAKWEEITDELGREKQIAAYTRSIGLEP